MFVYDMHRTAKLITSSAIVRVFVDVLKEAAHKYAFRATYCFMPDHVHLILMSDSDDTDLLRAVERYKQGTGYWLRRHHPTIRWQKGFCDRVIRANELSTQVHYLLDNPVRWRLVDDWRKYPFTGAIGMDLEGFLKGM